MTATNVVLALATGLLAGGLFSLVEAPIPAPPNAAGVMGIVGIYLGFKLVEWAGASVDVLRFLGG